MTTARTEQNEPILELIDAIKVIIQYIGAEERESLLASLISVLNVANEIEPSLMKDIEVSIKELPFLSMIDVLKDDNKLKEIVASDEKMKLFMGRFKDAAPELKLIADKLSELADVVKMFENVKQMTLESCTADLKSALVSLERTECILDSMTAGQLFFVPAPAAPVTTQVADQHIERPNSPKL